MDQPIGFILKGQEDKAYHLKIFIHMVLSNLPDRGTLDFMSSLLQVTYP